MRTLTLVLLASLLVACGSTPMWTVKNDQNLVYGNGMVLEDPAPIPGHDFWISVQVVSEIGNVTVLQCPPELASKCAALSKGKKVTYRAWPHPGSNLTLEKLSTK